MLVLYRYIWLTKYPTVTKQRKVVYYYRRNRYDHGRNKNLY